MTLTDIQLVRDEGTIVLFTGDDETGRSRMFAVDHRYAQAIVDASNDGSGEAIEVELEPYQLLGEG